MYRSQHCLVLHDSTIMMAILTGGRVHFKRCERVPEQRRTLSQVTFGACHRSVGELTTPWRLPGKLFRVNPRTGKSIY